MRYALAMLSVLALGCSGDPGFRSIPTADLEDKIAGGWAGQMIGVSYGAPTEFRHLEEDHRRGRPSSLGVGKSSRRLESR